MKHFIGTVEEMINGFETTNTVLVVARNKQSAQNKLNKIMKTWRGDGDDSHEDESGYWFDGGGICVTGYIQKEIPLADYLVLNQYI
jgi:hypothetical protein